MAGDIIIRPIEARDNAVLAKIIRQTLAEFGANHPGTVYFDESTDRLSTLFTIPGSAYFTAEVNAEVAGGGGIYPTEGLPAQTCELVKMYLLPSARGKGLGAALMKKCFAHAYTSGFRYIYLESMPELSTAVSLYLKTGFKNLDGPLGNTGHFGCGIWMLLDLDEYMNGKKIH